MAIYWAQLTQPRRVTSRGFTSRGLRTRGAADTWCGRQGTAMLNEVKLLLNGALMSRSFTVVAPRN